jgi:hypothetical protein
MEAMIKAKPCEQKNKQTNSQAPTLIAAKSLKSISVSCRATSSTSTCHTSKCGEQIFGGTWTNEHTKQHQQQQQQQTIFRNKDKSNYCFIVHKSQL